VLRDILTTVPHERSALMRIPLNFLDNGSVSGSLPSTYVPSQSTGVPEGDSMYGPTDPDPMDQGYLTTMCDFTQGLTSVAGTCVDANVDSSKVPDYEETAVYGEGGTPTPQDVACFDVTKCLVNRAPVPMQMITMAADGSCSFAINAGASGQNWNCALQTADGTGTCIGPNGGPPCYVPLESDPGEGFTVQPGQNGQMGQVTMVAGVCNKLMHAGAQLFLDRSSCATKDEGAPVCQPGETQMTTTAIPDAGVAMADASAPAPDGGVTFADSSTMTCAPSDAAPGCPQLPPSAGSSCSTGGAPTLSCDFGGASCTCSCFSPQWSCSGGAADGGAAPFDASMPAVDAGHSASDASVSDGGAAAKDAAAD
jgi:hypothetical protein